MGLEGLQLGQYRLLRRIGGGGMGDVYLAEDARISQQVAIKVSRTEGSSYPNSDIAKDAMRLFQREAKAIARLDHPRILPLFGYGEDRVDGMMLTYIVMPFRREGSFADWLQQRSSSNLLSVQDVAYFINQAADALQYAHDNQVVHQDVKPSNFLIRTNKENLNRPDLLLADFGIAKLNTTTSSAIHSARGTSTYMAPEQWSGDPVPATDQYALAIMAYELLTGRPPFQGRPEQMMYLHFNVQPQPPSALNPQLSRDIDTVLLRALVKKPEDRFLSISAFARAFQQAAQGIDAPTVVRTANVVNSSDVHATLAISKKEAQTGTNRALTLPGGRQVAVSVPAGAYNGQVIRVEKVGESGSDGTPAGALILTLSVKETEERGLPSNIDSTSKTAPASNPRITEETLIPYSIGSKGQTQVVPNPPTPAPSLTEVQATIQRQGSFTGKTWLLVGLALLVVVASAGFFYFQGSNRSNTNNGNAVSTTQAQDATSFAVTSTTQANNANATTSAQGNATATTQAIYANTTAQAINANPTPTASNANSYPPPGATLILNDPLSDNSQGHKWETTPDAGGVCAFTGGAYQVNETRQQNVEYCPAYNTDIASNFVYEVQMTIIQGDVGGLLFRDDSGGKTYYFRFSYDGHYTLLFYTNDASDTKVIILEGSTSVFNAGFNQSNLLAVVVRGGNIGLYMNKQLINSVNMGTYGHGFIGVFVNDKTSPTKAVFSNAKVWTF